MNRRLATLQEQKRHLEELLGRYEKAGRSWKAAVVSTKRRLRNIETEINQLKGPTDER
jgi:hypothetical protein